MKSRHLSKVALSAIAGESSRERYGEDLYAEGNCERFGGQYRDRAGDVQSAARSGAVNLGRFQFTGGAQCWQGW